ncbi:putative adhesin [Bifidobacterium moukalabense DSM 27321]|uniref:Putative adhesin n=1 Tax=Bifidobacterium moukalabense DSM 27321 TaxID=1435051 RepID=W4NAE9_9BIFI|nr:Cna B-type domain-containing protein [Bifidobacterium moukalabense]ETY71999.1 putative adhesin [Bifidobacterium moukalabense DSM 27321]
MRMAPPKVHRSNCPGRTIGRTHGPAYTRKKSGKSVAYTVKEIGTVDGYTGEVTGDMTSGFTVTNTVKPTPDKPTPDKPATPSKSTPDKPAKKTMAATGSSLIVPGVVLAVLVVVAAIVGGVSLFMRRRGGR